MRQVMIRVDDATCDELDRLVAEGVAENRSDAVREAIAAWIDRQRRAALDRLYEEAYTRQPETPGEMAWADHPDWSELD